LPSVAGGRASVAVGASSWQDAQNPDDLTTLAEIEPNPELADAQPPLLNALQLADVANGWPAP
jgi:hypothetical protein